MPKTILIVDDDRTQVHLLAQSLEKEGYKTVVAYDGAEAIRKVEENHVDLILLDVQMPRVHGYSFIFELRKIEGGVSIPVLVLTVNREMGDIFVAEGVKEYIIKPCSPQVIMEKVRKYV